MPSSPRFRREAARELLSSRNIFYGVQALAIVLLIWNLARQSGGDDESYHHRRLSRLERYEDNVAGTNHRPMREQIRHEVRSELKSFATMKRRPADEDDHVGKMTDPDHLLEDNDEEFKAIHKNEAKKRRDAEDEEDDPGQDNAFGNDHKLDFDKEDIPNRVRADHLANGDHGDYEDEDEDAGKPKGWQKRRAEEEEEENHHTAFKGAGEDFQEHDREGGHRQKGFGRNHDLGEDEEDEEEGDQGREDKPGKRKRDQEADEDNEHFPDDLEEQMLAEHRKGQEDQEDREEQPAKKKRRAFDLEAEEEEEAKQFEKLNQRSKIGVKKSRDLYDEEERDQEWKKPRKGAMRGNDLDDEGQQAGFQERRTPKKRKGMSAEDLDMLEDLLKGGNGERHDEAEEEEEVPVKPRRRRMETQVEEEEGDFERPARRGGRRTRDDDAEEEDTLGGRRGRIADMEDDPPPRRRRLGEEEEFEERPRRQRRFRDEDEDEEEAPVPRRRRRSNY